MLNLYASDLLILDVKHICLKSIWLLREMQYHWQIKVCTQGLRSPEYDNDGVNIRGPTLVHLRVQNVPSMWNGRGEFSLPSDQVWPHVKVFWFIFLHPPICSHNLPPLAGLYTWKPFQSPKGYSRVARSIKRTSFKHCLIKATYPFFSWVDWGNME